MKTNGKHEVMAGIARHSLVLAALLAMVLSVSNISHAQLSATSPVTPVAKPAAASAKGVASPATKAPAKGRHEGITVHGHWVLEVKNPDGSLAKRVEFENSLVTSGASATGSQALIALLSGNASLSPTIISNPSYSPWLIMLLSLNNGDSSPCGDPDLDLFEVGVAAIGAATAPNSCNILTTSVTPSTNTAPATLTPPANNLSFPTYSSSLPSQLIISGTTAPAVAPGTIDTVYTLILLDQVLNQAPVTSTPFPFPFTSVTLPPPGSGCGGANQPQCAVSVGVGQTVSATVTISFS